MRISDWSSDVCSSDLPQDGDAAMSVIQQLAAKYPDNAGAPHAVALVALRFNQLELADSASQQALQMAPQDRAEKLLRVGVMVRIGRTDDADAAIENLVKKAAKADNIRQIYTHLLPATNQHQAYSPPRQPNLHQTPKQD